MTDTPLLTAEPICSLYSRGSTELQPGESACFISIIEEYYQIRGRKFPWRETCDPYAVLLSELMLQQTQTERVHPKYHRFLELWPDFYALDQAPFPEILKEWKGLGYNRRAIALKEIAKISVAQYHGSLPVELEKLRSLPMVGAATAAAVRSFSFNLPSLYLETNIRRVLLYFFFDGEEKIRDRDLYEVLEQLQSRDNPKQWYYALMDYGVYLKKQMKNPNIRSAHYVKQGRFENSNRQIRGQILTVFTERGVVTREELYKWLNFEEERIDECLEALIQEKFIVPRTGYRRVPRTGYMAENTPAYTLNNR